MARKLFLFASLVIITLVLACGGGDSSSSAEFAAVPSPTVSSPPTPNLESTIAVTIDLYSHVTPGLQEAAALRFEDALQVKAEEPQSVPESIPV